MNRQLLLLALLGAAALAHAEQVYKWTDAAGIVHYSDSPPPAEAQNVQTVRVSGGDRPHAVPSEAPATAPETPKPTDTPATAANTAEARARNCETARTNLAMLQSKYPMTMAGPDGKQAPVDDKKRAEAIELVNAQIAQYCH